MFIIGLILIIASFIVPSFGYAAAAPVCLKVGLAVILLWIVLFIIAVVLAAFTGKNNRWWT